MKALRSYGILALGFAVLIAGVIVGISQPVAFGWTAYAPLSGAAGLIAALLPVVAAAAPFIGVGLVLIVGWVAVWVTRRRRGDARS